MSKSLFVKLNFSILRIAILNTAKPAAAISPVTAGLKP